MSATNSTATSPTTKVNNTIPGGAPQGAKPGQGGTQQPTPAPATPAPANSVSTYAAPVGTTESTLLKMLMGPNITGKDLVGPGGSFVNSMARGVTPPNILQQFLNQAATQKAGILESMGGSRYGTDAASAVARAQGKSLTDLLAGTEAGALGANQLNIGANTGAAGMTLQRLLGLGTPLLSTEVQRNQNAQTMAFQDFLRQTGLPPELATLLGAAGLGGGTTNSAGNTSGTNWGVNLLGQI